MKLRKIAQSMLMTAAPYIAVDGYYKPLAAQHVVAHFQQLANITFVLLHCLC